MSTILLYSSIAANVFLIFAYFRKQPTEITNDPLTVREFKEMATKQELREHVAADDVIHKELFAKVGGVERGVEGRLNARIDANAAHQDGSRKEIHKDIEAMKADIASSRTEIKMVGEQVNRMDGKIDKLMERKNAH